MFYTWWKSYWKARKIRQLKRQESFDKWMKEFTDLLIIEEDD